MNPLDQVFEQPKPGLLSQSLITTHIKDGMLRVTTTKRSYYGDTNYQDSTTTETICRVEQNV